MKTSLFDYHLPPDRIAQRSVEPRDHAKLLVLDRQTGHIQDRHIFDLPSFLRPNDLLIFNDSKVFRARLQAIKDGREHEVFLLHPIADQEGIWEVLIARSRKLNPNDTLTLPDDTSVTLVKKNDIEGTCRIDFHRSHAEVFSLSERFGAIPTPPYVDGQDIQENQYQTIYAKNVGSVAAPTAGFHFTPGLLEKLDQQGIRQAFVTLHVGLGTFRPMKSETLNEHTMHEEWASLSKETAQAIADTKANGGRVIAVGTTSIRVLETFQGKAGEGWTRLFIQPGYTFTTIDGLLTNFHLPKSTLLVLVSTFAGRENILRAYQHAINHEYRFYSFGDGMLIV